MHIQLLVEYCLLLIELLSYLQHTSHFNEDLHLKQNPPEKQSDSVKRPNIDSLCSESAAKSLATVIKSRESVSSLCT